jgi:hypothetical protein
MELDSKNIEAMKKIKDALDALQGIKYEEGVGFVPIDGTEVKTVKQPDALWHFRISIAKSIIRIGAGVALATGEIFVAGSLLILAEILGIGEELV